MVMGSRLLVLFAESPVHAGGSEAVGAVDLPIQREASTGLPVIWGQSLKGALREAARDDGWELADERAVFGSRPPGYSGADGDADEGTGDAKLRKGKVAIGDAQLLLFPVPTLRAAFAWTTAPLALHRLGRKLTLLGVTRPGALNLRPADGTAAGSGDWQGQQALGPIRCGVTVNPGSASLGAALARLICPSTPGDPFGFTRTKLGTDVLTVEDTVFKALTEMGTDIVARVQLEPDAKSVANGPFYSEHLPAETVLAAYLDGPEPELRRLSELVHGKPLRLGGDETLGKGIVWGHVHDTASAAEALNDGGQP
jgi:CRISPR-associated protein Cmr4